MIASYSIYFSQPWWLAASVLIAPIVWLAYRNLGVLTRRRRLLATILRCIVVLILVALLARPKLTEENRRLSVLAVIDRSMSIPEPLRQSSLAYLAETLQHKEGADMLAVVDIAEAAGISKLPSGDLEIRERNTTLRGQQSDLARGVQMAMAIAPADTANRILLVSDGNETAGDLKEAARIAGANGIPIDVLPLRYNYDREVIFKRLSAPVKARSGQTISLRFVLSSTTPSQGRLMLSLNGEAVDLDPQSSDVTIKTSLGPGTNVKTVSLPVGLRGMHEFEATYIPDEADQDRISQNNRATAMTFVAGPGHVLITDADGASGLQLKSLLQSSDIGTEYIPVFEFPDNLARLMDTDAVVLVDTDCSNFTYQQQEMLKSYVTDMGGGLIMVGGANSYGAGGWIGSPVAEILPVDLDPPQKRELPKGALVLIMHACEIPMGNYWGKMIAESAVNTLSRLDYAGVLAYGQTWWVYPLKQVGDKKEVLAAINRMQMGDMPDLGSLMQEAYDELSKVTAGQKHVIIISDGDPQPPTFALLKKFREAQITATGVAINPHSPKDVDSLKYVAANTGGRFYNPKSAAKLPKIFIKEAQVVRRALIIEDTFSPAVVNSLNEITRGVAGPLPPLDGYVLTGPKSGLAQTIMVSNKADPIFAICQAGLGRCAAFTSSVDSRWASSWIQWSGAQRFWEQAVRWAGKSAGSKSSDCDVFADVQGRDVTINVEAVNPDGSFIQFSQIDGQVISPEIDTNPLELSQSGPGQFNGIFRAGGPGSYIVNLRYRKVGDEKTHLTQIPINVPFAPEYRDLTDNSALLKETAEITGGRVLAAPWETDDPAAQEAAIQNANIYQYGGMEFPQTQLPIIRPLMLAWLVFFLLDVAVRRIAVDFKALYRKFQEYLKMKLLLHRKSDKTLENLKATRKKMKDQLAARSKPAYSSKRYEASEKYSGKLPETPDLPKTDVYKEDKADDETRKDKKAETADEQSHINQLLKAKRKFGEHGKSGEGK